MVAYGISIMASSTIRLLDGDRPVVSVSQTTIGRRTICFFLCFCFCFCAEDVLGLVVSLPVVFVDIGVLDLDLLALTLFALDVVSFSLVFFAGLVCVAAATAVRDGVMLLDLRVRVGRSLDVLGEWSGNTTRTRALVRAERDDRCCAVAVTGLERGATWIESDGEA